MDSAQTELIEEQDRQNSVDHLQRDTQDDKSSKGEPRDAEQGDFPKDDDSDNVAIRNLISTPVLSWLGFFRVNGTFNWSLP